MGTLYGFKHPSQYDKESLFKPASKANTKLILAEEDNIQHILASLALKVTRQSVIIAKLSSYPRKNRTKKALWELDNLRRSLHLLVAGSEPFLTRLILGFWNRNSALHSGPITRLSLADSTTSFVTWARSLIRMMRSI
jgi:TnpA family transposase